MVGSPKHPKRTGPSELLVLIPEYPNVVSVQWPKQMHKGSGTCCICSILHQQYIHTRPFVKRQEFVPWKRISWFKFPRMYILEKEEIWCRQETLWGKHLQYKSILCLNRVHWGGWIQFHWQTTKGSKGCPAKYTIIFNDVTRTKRPPLAWWKKISWWKPAKAKTCGWAATAFAVKRKW